MSISKASLVLAIVLAGLAGCASTSFVSTWKEPLDGPMEFRGKRVAAIVIHPDAALRRGAENELAKEISKRGAQGVAAYTLYEGEPPQDEAAARKLLQDAGIDGAVVMHPVGTEQETTYNPGMSMGPWYSGGYYGSFYGYWGYGWGAAYSPGYLRTDKIVYVETLVYSVPEGKLLWSGRSKTTNPSDVSKFVRELSAAAASEMKKAGFIS